MPNTGNKSSGKILRISRMLSMKMRRRGVEMRLVLDGHVDLARKADPALLKAGARARRWFEQITSCQGRSSAEIARRYALPKGYVAAIMRLAFLSPTLVDAVVEGHTPAGISLQRLINGRVGLPLLWRDQGEWVAERLELIICLGRAIHVF